MKLKHRQVPFQIKATKDDGSFEGYASVFGVTDAYRDVVMPGAFAQSLADWKAQDAMPPVLWQHRSDQPIGYTTAIAEDGKGLAVSGQLLVKDVQQAREAFAFAKAKVVRGLSIGYNPVDEEYDAKTNVNRVLRVDLWEYSFATFPANTEATITQVKALLESGETPTLREFERLLREQCGYSRKQAEHISTRGYANFLVQRDAGHGDDVIEDVEAILALFKEPPIIL
jgi:HK97 family phage prohead protease